MAAPGLHHPGLPGHLRHRAGRHVHHRLQEADQAAGVRQERAVQGGIQGEGWDCSAAECGSVIDAGHTQRKQRS